jgi:DNA-binding NarL/FixJ family response regulator
VDDHELARAGLRRLLRRARDLEIVGEVASAQEALEVCQARPPDLVIMDVRLADVDGLRVTRLIRERSPSTRVLLFTMYEAAEYMAEAQQAGASGYLLKGASRAELLAAIRRALAT